MWKIGKGKASSVCFTSKKKKKKSFRIKANTLNAHNIDSIIPWNSIYIHIYNIKSTHRNDDKQRLNSKQRKTHNRRMVLISLNCSCVGALHILLFSFFFFFLLPYFAFFFLYSYCSRSNSSKHRTLHENVYIWMVVCIKCLFVMRHRSFYFVSRLFPARFIRRAFVVWRWVSRSIKHMFPFHDLFILYIHIFSPTSPWSVAFLGLHLFIIMYTVHFGSSFFFRPFTFTYRIDFFVIHHIQLFVYFARGRGRKTNAKTPLILYFEKYTKSTLSYGSNWN